MAGKTGYTSLDNSLAPTGPAQMDVISDHFDALIDGLVVANAAALPTSGNWPWRRAIAADTGILYVNPKGDTAWKAWESDWISYTPTLTGFTLGNGSSSFGWKYVGGDIRVKGGLTLGSTSAVPGSGVTLSLPQTRFALIHPYEAIPGEASFYDLSGTSPWVAGIAADNTSTSAVRIYPINSGQVTTALAPTVPFTWAVGDAIAVDFTYRPA